MKRNKRTKTLGFSIAAAAGGSVLTLSGLFGVVTGKAESYEQLYILLGIAFLVLGVAGILPFRTDGRVLDTKSILHGSIAGLVGFFGIIYLGLWLSGKFGSWDDIFLESSSATTTTNLSLVRDPEFLGQGLLFLRTATQWVCGFAAICFFSIFLPSFMGGNGFSSEASRNPIRPVVSIYLGASAVILLGYVLAGMGWFDALTHSFTTISTGGFSNYADGLAHFDSAAVEWVAAGGMLIAGIRPVLLWWAIRGSPVSLWRSVEMRIYLAVVFALTLALALGDSGSIRRGFFSATSAISGTGFQLENWTGFSAGLQAILLVAIATGTMSGTATGGFGLTRVAEGFQYIYREIYSQLHPMAVFKVKIGKKVKPETELSNTQSFQFFFLGTLAVGVFLLAQFGADLLSAIGGAVTAFASMGPSVGEFFVDADSLANLPRPARGVLSAMTLIGRVSIFPIMILLLSFWERLRLRLPIGVVRKIFSIRR